MDIQLSVEYIPLPPEMELRWRASIEWIWRLLKAEGVRNGIIKLESEEADVVDFQEQTVKQDCLV